MMYRSPFHALAVTLDRRWSSALRAIVAAAAWTLLAPGTPGQPVPFVSGDDWWQRAPVYRSKYYNVKTDLPNEDARELAAHMDATFESYVTLFSKLPVRARRPARLDLYLFATQEDFLKILQVRFRDDGTGAWGKCITEGDEVSLVGWRGEYSNEQMKELLQHEGFHQVASHYFSGLPPWANEGLAEIFERGIRIGDQLVLGEFPPDRKQRLLEAVDAGRIMPFDRFFVIDGSLWSHQVRAGDPAANYLQAWSLVHFFLFAEEGKYEVPFLTFLLQLNRTEDWQRAFVAAFGVPNFRVIEEKWLAYVRNRPATDYREAARRLDFLAAGMLAVHNSGRRAASLAELEAALREIDFTYASVAFGQTKQLSAAGQLPSERPGEPASPGWGFSVIDIGGGEGRGGKRSSPPNPIVWSDVYPQTFLVEWRPNGGSYTYRILSGHQARVTLAAAEKRALAAARRRERRLGDTTNDLPMPSGESLSAEMRVWTTENGRHTTEARLVERYGEGVELEKVDGSRVIVPYRVLSDADRAFVDAWRDRQSGGDSNPG